MSFRGKQEQVTVPFFAISEFHDKISGDILVFSVDSDKEYESEKCAEKSSNGSIISIDQLYDK